MNKHNQITLGSLFDGIGGFPYAGSFFGIKPLWASEIMPQAISVTRRRLTEMAHVGDITALDGAKLPPVDIVTFGSPCQDLSVAGRRAGLEGARSGLFMEAVRIINEMRRATNGQYPRYAVWENVPGALSSSSGLDFQAVLEAFTKTEVPIPRSGSWANAGMVRGNGIDIAWCVYNAQHFGVPQRRRRIFLVCDFDGGSAGEVLFVAKSLSGYFAARRAQGQETAADAAGGFDGASIPASVNETAATIFAGYGNHWNGNAGAYDGGHFALSPAPECLTPWDTQQSRIFTEEGLSPTLAGADGGGGRNPAGLIIQETEVKTAAFLGGASAKARSIGYSEEVSPTLKGEPCGFSAPCVCEPALARTLTARGDGSPNVDGGPNIVAVGVHVNQLGEVNTAPTAYTLATNGNTTGRNAPLVAYASGISAKGNGDCFLAPECHYALTVGGGMPGQGYPAALVENAAGDPKAFSLDSDGSNSMRSANPLSGCREVETARTLDTTNPCPSKNQGGIAIVDVHPDVAGTLVASAAGLNRPARMANETDLCVAYCLQGNMIGRQDHNGPRGGGVNEELATATDVSGVAALFKRQRSDSYAEDNIAGTQTASQCKGETDLVCENRPDVTAVDCRNLTETEERSGTLQSKQQGYSLNFTNPVRSGYIVRRLLPVECERLQGYPDGWTEFGHDEKPISDTLRYQMLGNSVAVPCVAYILLGIAEQFWKEAKGTE